MARQYVYTMLRMSKSYGTRQILKDINLCFFPGAKIGVVGTNGSGKSTLLKIMAGLDTDFDGEAAPEKGVRVGMVSQEPHLDPDKTVRELVEEAFGETTALLAKYDELSEKMAQDLTPEELEKVMDRMSRVQDSIDAADGWEVDRQITGAADALVLPPDDQKAGTLSGGEGRRVALCRALLEKPDILLLDEPTNHLDAETVEWLEEQLREYPGTVIIVTHDRYFLDNITKWILELDNGKGIPFEGNYTSWLEQKLGQMVQTEKKESDRRRSLERELKWIHTTTAGRHEMSHARVAQYEQLVAREHLVSENATVIEIPPGPRLGSLVLEVRGVSKKFGDGAPLIDDLSFTLPRGAIVGVVGPNGAGKTTLFKMILGQEEPDAGTIVLGETVQPAYVDQHRDSLVDDKTVWEEISDGQEDLDFGGRTIASRNYVSRFNFKGTDQQKRVGDLSGGERNRVHLAKLIRRGGNFLMLDEPTNDLDVNALRMLEDAIDSFSGCAMIISHDRFFLDRVCTHLLVFEGEGKVRWFEGNFQDYERWHREQLGDKLFANRRSRYRRLALK
jgi:ATP-binding cassette ChvD family protein